jgi:hypothetical protein
MRTSHRTFALAPGRMLAPESYTAARMLAKQIGQTLGQGVIVGNPEHSGSKRRGVCHQTAAATIGGVAALLARGDALSAVGGVAAAWLIPQRAAALAPARAVMATGRTYGPLLLQATGVIGVVAVPTQPLRGYCEGAALGNEDAVPLLGGRDVKARQ